MPEGLVVNGDLDLHCCYDFEYPKQLFVKGNLTLPYSSCNLMNLDVLGIVSGIGYHSTFTNKIYNVERTDTIFGIFNTQVYKEMKILNHFDSNCTIDSTHPHFEYYDQNKSKMDSLIYKRRCFRIAVDLFKKKPLTPHQEFFKKNLLDEDANLILQNIIDITYRHDRSLYIRLVGDRIKPEMYKQSSLHHAFSVAIKEIFIFLIL